VLAEERVRSGANDDLGELSPIYLRPAEAESRIR